MTRSMQTQVGLVALLAAASLARAEKPFDPTAEALSRISQMNVRPSDWPQWGGSSLRNNTPDGKNIPIEWDLETGKNVKWTAGLGSQSYGNPTIANGKVYVGTNNGMGYLKRYPNNVDLGCLLCFDEKTGKFLWQHSSEKLSTGRVHDWPQQGICCAPYVEGDRLWFVTSRGLVVCADTEGFLDGENDGPFKEEPNENKDEADVVWQVDMMKDLKISQHNMCSCSVTMYGDLLFVLTGNGVDEGHINIPAPQAPSFVCLDRKTGKVHWTDNTPGTNVLHGQWSSPAVAELGGVTQVLFPGGDGWLYSFKAAPEKELIWKFDCNPKESLYVLGAKADRNHLIGTPVVYDGLVFIAVGEDPEHGEGVGHLWCIDPTKKGDVSPQLVFNKKNPGKVIPHKRLQAADAKEGDYVEENPNSAVVWHFGGPLRKSTEKKGSAGFSAEPEKEMHRTCGSVAIKDGLLVIVDFSGFVHCLDVKTGEQLWGYDLLAASWGSPLIVEGKIYIGDEDGDITVFDLAREMNVIYETNMGNSVYTSPVVANNVLFIADRTHLYALETGAMNPNKPSDPSSDSAGE